MTKKDFDLQENEAKLYEVINFLIQKHYWKLSRFARTRISEDDLFQEAMTTILTCAFPNYNPAFGVSFSHWCWCCINARFLNIIKIENRELLSRSDLLEDAAIFDYAFACDTFNQERRYLFLEAFHKHVEAAPDIMKFLSLNEVDREITRDTLIRKEVGRYYLKSKKRKKDYKISEKVLKFLGVKNLRTFLKNIV